MNVSDYQKLSQEIQNFITKSLIPHESLLDSHGVPLHLQNEMKKMGLFGLTIPKNYGGLGITLMQEIELMFLFGLTSPVFQFCFGTNQGIGSHALLLVGSATQKEKYLPKLASGHMISAFALTEEGAGSDASAISTTAKPVDGGWLLNGKKRFISNAPIADLFTVIAYTPVENKKQFSAFILEKPMKGLTIGKPDIKMGHHGALTAEITMHNCYIENDNLLGNEGSGLDIAMQAVQHGRLVISALSVGIAERLIEDSLQYALSRHQFSKPIFEFQLIKAMLADCYTEAYAARCMVKETVLEISQGKQLPEKVSACKYYSTEMVGRVADKAVQIHGGAGYMNQTGIERFYRDVRLFRIYEGTNQIQQLIIAKSLANNFKAKLSAETETA